MAVEHSRVGVVEDRRLHPPAEQRLRLAHEVLVERVLARDQDRQAVSAPSGPAPLLAEARHGAGEAGRDHAVEQPDVDAELERVGRGHPEQLAGGQPLLDVPPLCRRVPGPVRREPVAVLRAEPVDGEPVDQLCRLPALREAERPQPTLDERCHQTRRLSERACADAELLVEELGVPERDRPLRARRGVVADHGDVDAEQRAREPFGVRDRRGGEQELGLGAVDPRDPPEPAEDVADVRAEHTAIDVCFVDHHVGEVREHVAPAVVMGEDADVQHVGVGQHEVRPLADLPAALDLGVAVVDRRPDARHLQRRSASGAGPGRAPSSGRGRARAASARVRARRARAG